MMTMAIPYKKPDLKLPYIIPRYTYPWLRRTPYSKDLLLKSFTTDAVPKNETEISIQSIVNMSTSNTVPSTPTTSSSNPTLPPPSSQTPQAGNPSSSAASQSYHHLPYEERLPKIWRPLVSSIAGCMSKAEKAGAESTQANCKELNESVVTFLRTRMELHRIIGHVEAKFQGKAQEIEALECYVRTQPRLGKRKRNEEAIAAAELLQTEMQKVAADASTTVHPLVDTDHTTVKDIADAETTLIAS